MAKHLDTQKIVDARRLSELEEASESVRDIIVKYGLIERLAAEIKYESRAIKDAQPFTHNGDIRGKLDEVCKDVDRLSFPELVRTRQVGQWIEDEFHDALSDDGVGGNDERK